MWRAAGQLGAGEDAAAPAAAAGLIEPGGQIRFPDPLTRYALYQAASPQERQRAHRALAEAISPATDLDRRAWHRAHAVPGLDEDAAAELERTVGQAQARGGLAAAAAFRGRAAELTYGRARRAERALAAAGTSYQAGAPTAALRLLAMAQAGPLGKLGRARAELVGARLAADSGQDRDAAPLLLGAARRLEPLDPGLAREACRDAFCAALKADRLAGRGALLEVAAAVRAARPARSPARAPDLLLSGLAAAAAEGCAAAAPLLRQALTAFRSSEIPTEEALRWLPLACRMSCDLLDDESLDALSARLIGLARSAGALAVLPAGLLACATIQLLGGEPGAAASMAREAAAVTQETGSPVGRYGPLLIAAWRGRETEAAALITAATPEMTARGEGQWLTAAHWAAAILGNGLCRYEEALAAAEQAIEGPHEGGLATWSMTELIEAAARTGRPGRAAEALHRLAEVTSASGTDWALGIQARCRALLTSGEAAEPLYREAIERLGRTPVRTELARAHLVYGEWLRRNRRRVDAREQLRGAHEMLTAMGIEGFAERARRELIATGQTLRKRTVDTVDELTAQEAQVARLAREGHTNPEIGAQLFISARTVEWHLRKVFTKLGISSRRELHAALPELARASVGLGRASLNRERSTQPVAASGGCPAEALPGAFRPFRIADRIRVSRKIMAEDQLADPRAFGDAPDLGDVGVQPGLPFQGRTGRAVPLEIVKVGDLVNEDVRPLCEGDQVIVDGGVTGEHDGAVRGVETVRQRRNRVAVRHGHGGDPDSSVVGHGHRNLGDASAPGRDADVGGPDESARVRHGGVERHDVQMVGKPGQDGVDQVRRPGERPFRVDRGPAVEGALSCGRRFGARRPVHADRRQRAVSPARTPHG